jgi:SlyX protein
LTGHQGARERIDALEMRLAFQDETIETLNQTITAQWKQIDALTRQLAELKERLQEAESNARRPRQRTARRIIESKKNGLPKEAVRLTQRRIITLALDDDPCGHGS